VGKRFRPDRWEGGWVEVFQNKVLCLASQLPSVMVIGLKEKLVDMPRGYLSFVVTVRDGYKQSVQQTD
jgi:hypothetical protein